jgi:hypothetical protein
MGSCVWRFFLYGVKAKGGWVNGGYTRRISFFGFPGLW